MKTTVALILLVFALLYVPTAHADTFGSGDDPFDIDFVTIGNPGNADDITGKPNPAGKVEYAYRIGKFEISKDMIDEAYTEGGLGITKDTRGANKPATVFVLFSSVNPRSTYISSSSWNWLFTSIRAAISLLWQQDEIRFCEALSHAPVDVGRTGGGGRDYCI